MRVAAAEAAAAGLPGRDPADALVAAATEADRIVRGLAARVSGGDGELVPNDLAALGEWLDRVGRLARSVVDSRVLERQARLAERQGELLAEVIRRILDALDLDARQRALVGVVVPRELRAVAATEVRAVDSGSAGT